MSEKLGAVVAVVMGLLTSTSSDAADPPDALTLDELLALPYVRFVESDGAGRIAWTEQSDGVWNAWVATAPDYAARRVTNYTEDDGQVVSLVGFVPGADALIVRRGAGTLNPAHLPDPPKREYLLISLPDGTAERLETNGALAAPEIAPDGTRLYAAKGGDVWSFPLASERAGTRLFSVRGRVTGLWASPDGGKLAFLSDRSVYKRGKYAFVGVFDLQTRTITYLAPGLGIDQNPVWSPDGTEVAFIRFGYEPRTWRFSNHREGAPFSVIVADAETGEGKAVFTSKTGYGSRFNGFRASGYSGLGGVGNLLWLADGTLVFPYEKTGWKLLYGVPSTGGEAWLLTPGEFEIDGATLSPDRTTVVYWANSERDPHRLDLYRAELDGALRPEPVGTAADETMRYRAVFVDDDTIAYFHAGPKIPERLVVRLPGGRIKQLSTGPAPGDPITSKGRLPELVSFKSLDGMEIPAILYRPRSGRGAGRHPVIVNAHGGSRYKVYPIWDIFFGHATVIDYFLGRGYFVLDVNYRSGTGYGLNFREPESYGGRGAGDVDDFIAAAEYLRTNVPEIDPDRMVIYGHSYGGHIVSNVLARSDVFAAGIDSAGVGDWVVEMEKDFNEVLQFNIPQRLELERLAHESSAISKIDEWGDEPILFLHGDNDSSAAMQQSLELYLALQRRGKDVDALIFPGEAHGILLRRNQIRYIRRIEDFLDRRLQ